MKINQQDFQYMILLAMLAATVALLLLSGSTGG